jgi:hypothetical protein
VLRPTRPRSVVRRLSVVAAAALAVGLGPTALAGATTSTVPPNAVPPNAVPPSVVPSSASSATAVGLTVSWLPVATPVTVVPGRTTHGVFWITNETSSAVPVQILPATALPGNNGALVVRTGKDDRFPDITYTPQSLVAEPGTTTPVTVAVVTPPNLAPGVYLLPAAVRPEPVAHGNVQIQQEIDALVTLEVPGRSQANVQPAFVSTTASLGGPTSHLPGLPPIQIGTAGREVLRVLDDSPSSFYAYNEITANQSPFGEVVFDGHTTGAPSDLRTPPDLYFPGHWRDYPVTWHASKLGLGVADLHAYVSYHTTSSTVAEKEVMTQVLVISPWWVFVLFGYLLVLLAVASRAARRLARVPAAEPRSVGAGRRVWQGLGSLVTGVITLAAAFVGQPAVVVAVAGRRPPTRLARWLRGYVLAATGVLLFGGVAVCLAGLSSWSGTVAVGVLAGVGVWTLVGWWLLWWAEEHPATSPAEPVSDPSGEPAPVG